MSLQQQTAKITRKFYEALKNRLTLPLLFAMQIFMLKAMRAKAPVVYTFLLMAGGAICMCLHFCPIRELSRAVGLYETSSPVRYR